MGGGVVYKEIYTKLTFDPNTGLGIDISQYQIWPPMLFKLNGTVQFVGLNRCPESFSFSYYKYDQLQSSLELKTIKNITAFIILTKDNSNKITRVSILAKYRENDLNFNCSLYKSDRYSLYGPDKNDIVMRLRIPSLKIELICIYP